MFCEKYDDLVAVLESRGYTVHHAATPQEAKKEALALLSQGASVGMGGSMTVASLGLYDELAAAGITVYSHAVVPPAKDPDIFRKENTADWYLCSTNALTRDGKLVNTDGIGNRVAGMIAGPKNVCLIVGKNKLVKDLSAALDRVRNVAAPPNARRLNRNTPCAHTDQCADCASADRMCRVTSIIEYRPTYLNSLHLILVDAELGY